MLKLKLQYFGIWCKELTHWKRSWCWERLKVGGEGYDRGWDGWMMSLLRWTWLWASPGTWWWSERPGMLQSVGSQRLGHDWATEMNWLIAFAFRICVQNMLINFFFFFFTALGLHCRWGFSLVAVSRGCSPCSTWASHCSGFSCAAQALGFQWLWHVGSRAQAQ